MSGILEVTIGGESYPIPQYAIVPQNYGKGTNIKWGVSKYHIVSSANKKKNYQTDIYYSSKPAKYPCSITKIVQTGSRKKLLHHHQKSPTVTLISK